LDVSRSADPYGIWCNVDLTRAHFAECQKVDNYADFLT